MTETPNGDERGMHLLPSGVEGLDTILKGGFLRGGIYLIQGEPGTGKTILGNQLCFNHAAEGGRALFVTLLTETHARMLMHHRGLAFFDQSVIPNRLSYVSAFRTLEEEGLPGLLQLLRREVERCGVSLLVLDGLVAARQSSRSDLEFKKFIHGLQAQATLADCTVFLLSSAIIRPPPPEHTMIDGVLELASQLFGRRAERTLEVVKRRGLGYLRGRHSVRITDAGLVVFPRIEALLGKPTREDLVDGPKSSTCIPELDALLGGGLVHCSTTMLVGPSGCGKTITGLQFLGGSSEEQPGLFFGFFETPARLRVKAKHLGLPIERAIAEGHVEILWQPMTEGVLDEVGNQLLEAVSRRKIRYLVFDGLVGLRKLAAQPERVAHFMTALSNELRGLGVTTLITDEADTIGPGELPVGGLQRPEASGIADNIVVMRFVELRTRLERVISVLKVRDSDFEHRLRGYTIAAGGIAIDKDSERAEAILAQVLGQRVRER